MVRVVLGPTRKSEASEKAIVTVDEFPVIIVSPSCITPVRVRGFAFVSPTDKRDTVHCNE